MTTAPNEEPGSVGPADPEDQIAIGEEPSSTGDYGQMAGSFAAGDQMGNDSVATRSTVSRQHSRRLENWVFGLIIALAAVLRFTGVNWDNGSQLHPDERFLFMVEGALRPGFVATGANGSTVQTRSAPIWEYYFDSARSGLNPHNVGYGFFVYGTFPLFATKWILTLFQSSGFDRVHLIGRSLSALSDTGSVALVAIIARRLFGSRVGLLAPALLAVCVLHIQQAHFFVFDSFLVTLVLACFWSCLNIVAFARWRDFAVTGLLLGLTLATKLSMVVFMPVIALAGLIHLWETHRAKHHLVTDDDDSDRPSPTIATVLEEWWNDGSLASVIAGGILTALVAILVFRIAQPYAFAGPSPFDLRLNPKWLDNIDYQAKSQDGSVDLPPSIQWAETSKVFFPLRHMVNWGLGLPLGVAVWASFFGACWLAMAKQRWQHALVAFWAGLCFLYFSSVLNKTMRYLLPSYPFFVILGSWGLVAAFDAMKNGRERVRNGTSFLSNDVPDALRSRLAALNLASISPLAPLVGSLAILAVLVYSSGWAFAFTRIYARPVSRGQASMWIYRNVPPPAVMANEHWDDPLPLPIPGFDHGKYAGPQLPLYDPDEPKKIDTIIQMLSQSSYMNITSNRLYGSIPRMPERYPMTSEYYRRLFAGDLGFSLVATIPSYPSIGPWVINDDAAEEAFTVYDHPKVLIFRKDPDFSAARVRQILTSVSLDNVQNIPPIMAGRPNLQLNAASREMVTQGGTWSDSFSLDDRSGLFAPVVWYLTLSVLGLMVAPLVWSLFPSLPDRGYGSARPLGLLAVSWLAWLLASIDVLPWTRLSLVAASAACVFAVIPVLRRSGREWVGWVRGNWSTIVTVELVTVGAFVAFCLIRSLNPDLWHPARGGEKPMEFAYLNAVIKTASFPPYDPWYAGGYLNYYYFGYVLIGTLAKLTGVAPSVAFNIGVATVYAMTVGATFGVASNLTVFGWETAVGHVRAGSRYRPVLFGGLAGVVFLAVVGNLDAFGQLVDRLARSASGAGSVPVSGLPALVAGVPAVLLGGGSLEGFDFWRSSRVIPNNTINEFPFWTFLFSDLHAHMISIPYQVVSVGVMLGIATRAAPTPRAHLVTAFDRLLSVLTLRNVIVGAGLGWVVGALNVINSWEYPTHLLLSVIALGIARVARRGTVTATDVVHVMVSSVIMFLTSTLWYRPFWSHYLSVYSSVSLWTTDKSTLVDYLIIHGAMVFQLLTFVALVGWPVWRTTGWGRYVAMRLRNLDAWERVSRHERALLSSSALLGTWYVVLFAIFVVLVATLAIARSALIAFLITTVSIMVLVAWERRREPALAFAATLGATGAAIGIFVEYFALSGDIGRMNTVFKFYLQVWVLWSMVSGATLVWAFARVFDRERRKPLGLLQWGWVSATAALMLAVLAYPLGAVPARVADRFAPLPPTLDGMAYMKTATVQDASSEVTPANPGGATLRAFADYLAIRWMLQNIDGTPVVLEASVPEYRWGSRVSKYTGLPAVLGWRWHQAQQRGPYAPQVDARLRDVQSMFNTTNSDAAQVLLSRYHVRYVYVGDLERAYYASAGIAKFGSAPTLFRPVYDVDGVTIYEFLPEAARQGRTQAVAPEGSMIQ